MFVLTTSDLIWLVSLFAKAHLGMNEGWCAGAADCSYASGLNVPFGVALDSSSGSLYVISGESKAVCRVPRGGGAYAGVRAVGGIDRLTLGLF